MRKACAYILVPLLVFNTYFNEVFKLPLLVFHYLEHVSLNDSLSVTDFLSMHYWGEDLKDNDQDKDDKLPFKKIDTHQTFPVAVPVARTTFGLRIFTEFEVLRPIFQDGHFSNPGLASLFRPPRA